MGGINIDPALTEALEGKSPEELQAMAEGVEKAQILGHQAVTSGTHEWEDGKLVATSDKYSDIVFDETGTYVSGGGVIAREETGPDSSGKNNDDLLEEEISEGEKLSVLNNQKSAFLAALRASGMSADMIDELWTWALAEFQSDPTFTADRALLGMYDQPAFKLRFPAIGQMEGAPTPGEYIQYERAIRQEFKKFGAGYPSANVITSLLIANVSTLEVTERLSEAERVLYSVPAEVRDTFNDWWGEEGAKEITMSLFLDPNQDWSNLQDKINTAEVGAWGKMVAGLDAGWDRDMANAVADLGLSQAQTWNSFASLKDKELLFAENIGEDRDLRYETEGVEAEFGIGGSALTLQDIIERRKQRRISRFAGGGTSQSGAIIAGTTTGMGSANA